MQEERARKIFELTPSRTSENALSASRPKNVSLFNADTMQVAITV